jgi:molybdenum-dependent DNA-binding transcriptional regulator ModE
MELRHLRYFIAVAEEGHITRAAERLGMQQPPLSQRIKAIERELEVQLFHRRARGVELTDAGRAFFNNARTVLAQLDHAFETTRRTARGEEGRISIGIVPTSPFHPFVPRVIRAFREAYPQVSLQLEERLGGDFSNYWKANKSTLRSSERPMPIRNSLSSTGYLRSRCWWRYLLRTHWLGTAPAAKTRCC